MSSAGQAGLNHDRSEGDKMRKMIGNASLALGGRNPGVAMRETGAERLV